MARRHAVPVALEHLAGFPLALAALAFARSDAWRDHRRGRPPEPPTFPAPIVFSPPPAPPG